MCLLVFCWVSYKAGQNGPLDFRFGNFAHGVGIQGGPERSILHYLGTYGRNHRAEC